MLVAIGCSPESAAGGYDSSLASSTQTLLHARQNSCPSSLKGISSMIDGDISRGVRRVHARDFSGTSSLQAPHKKISSVQSLQDGS